ncbi:thioesterase II family protein [Microbulbifer sp. ANSA003]|uniref:thioesterase II family protein n=1 Tax=Microbulbifer sp. ANSA003 TaxID=3243360 RepID=UPI0040421BF8
MNIINALSPWLININGIREDKPIIVMFAYAGAGASVFYSFSKALEGFSVLIVQLPGRGQRMEEPLAEDLGLCAGIILNELLRHVPEHARLVFFGHSMGALMAYEVARQYQLRVVKPIQIERLILSGRDIPTRKSIRVDAHTLPSPQFWQEVREMGGMSEEILAVPELLELVEPVLRADFKMNNGYAWPQSEPLPIPITVLTGTEDKLCNVDKLHDWQAFTCDDFELMEYDGGHFFINEHKKKIVSVIERLCLASDISYDSPRFA